MHSISGHINITFVLVVNGQFTSFNVGQFQQANVNFNIPLSDVH